MNLFRCFRNIKKEFGVVPLCNGQYNRAPHINGFCFPLCWRCTSITIVAFICGISDFIHHICYEEMNKIMLIILSIVLILPTLIDGVMQYKFYIESTNIRRIITGTMCGIGFWITANILSNILKSLCKY